jgi:DNA-binding XRE family transcriptional regulator
MARKFRELEAGMTPESIERSNATYKRLKQDMALEELRNALRLTQQQLAETLQVDQSAISKLERRTDMYVSTLDRFISGDGWKAGDPGCLPRGMCEYQPV